MLKPVLFEQLELGEAFGPVRVVADDAYVKQHAFAADDYHPWSMGGTAPDGTRVVQSTALLADLLRLLNERYDPHFDRGLHQREQWWHGGAVRVGDELELEGRLTETYWKRGRPYFVVDAEARRVSDGVVVLRHRAVEAVGIGDPEALGSGSSQDRVEGAPSRRVAGAIPEGAPAAILPLGAGSAVGSALPPLSKRPTQTQVSVFSNVGAFWRTTHTDLEVARAEGLDRPIAQGLMEACYIGEFALLAFGAAWLDSGHGDLAFVAPMFPGDPVVVRGWVSGVEAVDAGVRVEVECWVEHAETGAKLAVGWIDAVVPR